jgi:hypothetical protein
MTPRPKPKATDRTARSCAPPGTPRPRGDREDARAPKQGRAQREQLARLRLEYADLQRRMADLAAEALVGSERLVVVEQKNVNLANLYAATSRLHGTLDREEVLDTIQEIIVNLVGSEEFAILELPAGHAGPRVAAHAGVDRAALLRAMRDPEDPITRALQSGERHISGSPAGNPAAAGGGRLTACIPLKLEGRVTGAIAIFRLLPQKSGLDALDLELFQLLATHAASALHAAELHARFSQA